MERRGKLGGQKVTGTIQFFATINTISQTKVAASMLCFRKIFSKISGCAYLWFNVLVE